MKTTVAAVSAHESSLPRLVIADGTIEALKWLALVCMTCDHIDKYLLHASIPILFDVGRLAMPLFGFVLAYNLARAESFRRGVYQRAMRRLAVAGTLATPAFIGLGGLLHGWWPLNIMFALLTVTATLFLWERGDWSVRLAALAVAAIGGSSVEFWWPAVGFCIAVWAYCKRPSWTALLTALFCCAALFFINGNLWALASLPIVVSATLLRLQVPRTRLAFYAYYPLHLTVIWAVHALSS
jgi:hypothetical protein